jgi:hypothetical protein
LYNEPGRSRFNLALTIKPFNVEYRNELPEVTLDRVPVNEDPLLIDSLMYFVCEIKNQVTYGTQPIGEIPFVIKNTTKIKSIESYLESLDVALRRMRSTENILANQKQVVFVT